MVVGALVITVASVLVVVLVWLCAAGRIGRNPVVGLRVPALFASDETWTVGHRAALLPTVIAAVICVVFTAVAAAIPSLASTATVVVVVALIAGVVVGAVQGSGAATLG
jgi:SdpI/YfhL protein family